MKHERHGLRWSKEYRVWRDIKSRTLKPNACNYKRYGGRGITICDRWKDSFTAFYNDMGKCPMGRSIERINNDGDYEPSNCRWATIKEQAKNKHPRRNALGFRGIKRSAGGRYCAMIYTDRVGTYLGYFDTPEEAASAWNKEAIRIGRPIDSLNVINGKRGY